MEAGTSFTPVDSCDACAASVLFPGANAEFIAADESDIYWSGPGQQSWYVTSKCTIGACTPQILMTQAARAIGLQGNAVYTWTSDLARSCTKDCSDGGVFLPALFNDGVQGFAATGAAVFWSSQAGLDWQAASVKECDPAACDASVTLVANQPAPRDLLADDANVYWINAGAAVGGGLDWLDYADGGILRWAIGGCAGAVELVPHLTNAWGLVANTTAIFWLQGTSILMCSKKGCGGSPTVLATFADAVTNLAVDDAAAYFTLQDPLQQADAAPPYVPYWRIVKLPLDGSAAATAITQDQKWSSYGNIAVNSKDVFWVSSAGDLMMTAK